MIRAASNLTALGILAASCLSLWVIAPYLHESIGWMIGGYPGNITDTEGAR